MDEISLRKATLADADIMFAWRNAPETRKYFFDPRPIDKFKHIDWLSNSLTMTTRYLLIAEINQKPIGVLRYDLIDSTAEIDIYLNPELSGKGFGTLILKAGVAWAKANYLPAKTLKAKVIADNIGSRRAFEKAGFNLTVQIYEMDLEAN